MVWPLPANYPITTAYRKTGTLWRGCGWHTGVDMRAPAGTPLYAAIAGTVRHRNYGAAFGRFQFAISPSAGQPFADDEVFYGHCSERLPEGTEVRAGEYVGKVGYEGNVSPAGPAGAHLHFEYHRGKAGWDCGRMLDPRPVLDHKPAAAPTPPTTPVGGGGWIMPAGQKIYGKFLKVDGHTLNSDGLSDSIKGLQEVLQKHGYNDLPLTSKYWSLTDEAVRDCQAKHMPPSDPTMKSFVGPKQWAHLAQATGCPYEFVADTASSGGSTPSVPTAPAASDKPKEPTLVVPGARWDPVERTGGGYFTGLRAFSGTARKCTLHTTETAVKPNWFAQQSGIPHLTVDLVGAQMWQHLPLDRAAYTLQAAGEGKSPNSDSGLNIQIEIVGYAKDSGRWPDEQYAGLKWLLQWISGQLGVPYVFPKNFVNAQRLSWDEWAALSGFLGHGHAPSPNDHWDPGALDVPRLQVQQPVVEPEPPAVIEPEPPDVEVVGMDPALRELLVNGLRRLADEIEGLG